MPRVRMTAIVGHSTHDDDGRQVWHDAGTSYDIDESVMETLEAIGFAKRSESVPVPVQADDHTDTTTGPSDPPPKSSKRK